MIKLMKRVITICTVTAFGLLLYGTVEAAWNGDLMVAGFAAGMAVCCVALGFITILNLED